MEVTDSIVEIQKLVTHENLSAEKRGAFLAKLNELGIGQEKVGTENDWFNKEVENWNETDIKRFANYLFHDDERTVRVGWEEIASGETKPPDEFPTRQNEELRKMFEKNFVGGMDTYGAGVMKVGEVTDENFEDTCKRLGINPEKNTANIDFVNKIAKIVPMCGNTTVSALIVDSPVFRETAEWARVLRKVELIDDSDNRRAAIREASMTIKEGLVPTLGERVMIEGVSGTHLWYILSRSIVGQSKEAGKTVDDVAHERPLPVDVAGGKVEQAEDVDDRVVLQIPVRKENGDCLSSSEYQKMHDGYFVFEMALSLWQSGEEVDGINEMAKKYNVDLEKVVRTSGGEMFFTHSFVIPGKGGAIYKDMPDYLSRLNQKGLQESQNLSEAQKKIVNKFFEKEGKYEVVLDCAQGRWLSAGEALDILDKAGIQGWYMSTTSKAAEGAAFGGIAVGTKGVLERLKKDFARPDIYSTEILTTFYASGSLPPDLEDVISARIENDEKQGSGKHLEFKSETALLSRLAGAMRNYREIHETSNREGYHQKSIELLTEKVREYIKVAGLEKTILLQETGGETDFLSSSILTFGICKPDGKRFTAKEISRMRMIARLEEVPFQMGNQFGESVVADISADSGEVLPKDAKHDPFARLGMGSEILRLTSSLLEEQAKIIYGPAVIEQLNMITETFVGNMKRIVEMAQKWDLLESKYYS